MLPNPHVVPINRTGTNPLHSPAVLADAFSEFISASALLEASYRDLQHEVTRLGSKLAERNAELTRSLAENDRMRADLQQILDSMPCGVLVLNRSSSILMINPEGRSLLNLGTQPIRGLKELSSLTQIDFSALEADSGAHGDHEVCLTSPDGKRWLAIGERKLLRSSLHRQPSDRRDALQSVWILRDITATKHAEEERERTRKATALAETSAILAHEIRNPLASMELFAGLIAEDPAQTALWLSHLRAGIRQLSGTVNNVLTIQAGGDPHRLPIHLASCIRSSVAFVEPLADEAGVSLVCHVSTSATDISILGNENVIRQILLNLISNAIRHTPAAGEIRVELDCESIAHTAFEQKLTRAIVQVTDTGCGIPPDQIEQIFELGFSAHGDTPGLGLAVCKRLMAQHQGEISVVSRVHDGTTFRLEFPTL